VTKAISQQSKSPKAAPASVASALIDIHNIFMPPYLDADGLKVTYMLYLSN
jgi:hypothetical protein